MMFETTYRAVLLTDLVDSAGHIETIGDVPFAETMAELEDVIRHLIRQHNGREIDKTDGFLVVFKVPVDALCFGLAVNLQMERFSRAHSRSYYLRTGLHYGNIVLRSNSAPAIAVGAKSIEVDGLTKVIAARVSALADPGQLLITRTLFDLVREDTSTGDLIPSQTCWLAHGPYLMQGLQEPVEIYEVGIAAISPLRPPADKDKARRAILPQDEFALGWRPATGQIIPSAPDWKIIRKLGEGGYGEVWLAEHRKAKQSRVFKFCFDPTRIRSLIREKFLLSIIQDTLGNREDIVRILNWNMTEFPYFIALKYIPLENLATWMDHRETKSPLPLSTIIAIIHKVAEAIAAAHSVGILHKDIKPSNLLIGDDPASPNIYLIDFGIGLYTPLDQQQSRSVTGQTTESDRTTMRTSSLSGSRLYVAPEILEGKVPTTHADVYSLGVLLYQLLRNDLTAGLRVGWEREIPDPFLTKLIAESTDGDIRNRLSTASEFIDRIDSLDARRREAAAARQLTEQREKEKQLLEAQRRRKVLYAIALAMALPMTIVSGVFAFRASMSSKRADAKAQEATATRERAGELINFMLDDLTKELREAGQLPLMDSVTSQALGYFSDTSTNSLTRSELYNRAQALVNLGDIFFDRSNFLESGRSFESAEVLLATLLAEDSSDNLRYKSLLGYAQHSSAVVSERKGNSRTAVTKYDEALTTRRSLYRAYPDDFEVVKDYVRTCQVYGYYVRLQDKGSFLLDEAVSVSSSTLHICKHPDAKLLYANSLYYNSLPEAVVSERKRILREESTLIFEQLRQDDPKNYEYATALLNSYSRLANCYENNETSAIAVLEKAAAICDRLTENDPSNHEWNRMAGRSLARYADYLNRVRNYELAAIQGEKASKLFEKLITYAPADTWVPLDYWRSRQRYHRSLGLLGKKEMQAEAIAHSRDVYKNLLNEEPSSYLENYLLLSIQCAFNHQQSTCVEAAIDHAKSLPKPASKRVANLLQCVEALCMYEKAFKPRNLTWMGDKPLSGTLRGTFTILNTLPQSFVVRLYKPDSRHPFEQQLVPGAEIVNSAMSDPVDACRGDYGISVNGCPIMRISRCATYDPEAKAFQLSMREWTSQYGSKMEYEVKPGGDG